MKDMVTVKAPRIEIVLASDKPSGPYKAALVLHVPDRNEPETLGLFNGQHLSPEHAYGAILQIYTALGEQFQYSDFDVADTPARPPLS